jgi:5-formyltetrahydrofolate cyclo-ligase
MESVSNMAVPQLSQPHCFVELRADHLLKRNIPLTQAASIKVTLQVGRAVSFQQMQPIDLAVVGCVAVSQSGDRLSKGAGFADLELALLNQFSLLSQTMSISTTVHPFQFVADDKIPMQPHDWVLNLIVTPQETIYPQHHHVQPTGIDWNALNLQQLHNIPSLKSLRALLNIQIPK